MRTKNLNMRMALTGIQFYGVDWINLAPVADFSEPSVFYKKLGIS
jgi:hypothetical protein